MKLITLNTWGGRVFRPLVGFLKFQANDTDLFCFQEVFHTTTNKKVSNGARANTYNEIKYALQDYRDFYAPAQDGFDHQGSVDFDLSFGLAMFVKKTIPVEAHGDIFVFRERNARKGDNTSLGRNLEFLTFKGAAGKFTVFNFHGLWNGGEKTDTDDRLQQSRNVKKFINTFGNSRIILCGDFNLVPNTQSLAILAEGMRNLIKEFGVTSTRSSFYAKPTRFADYILISSSVNVRHFEVLQDEVSDHFPLSLEFD